jgi:membrane protein implicated in regulation of membrane protease activity
MWLCDLKGSVILLVLLLLVPSIVNFWTPLYNFAAPSEFGLPFFYWFQIIMLPISAVFYLIFSYIEGRRTGAP